MRKLITLFAVLCTASLAFGQSYIGPANAEEAHQALPESRYLETMQNTRPAGGTTVGTIGSVSGSDVTAVKVGEASNAFTSLVLETNQVYSMPDVGNGGTVAFLNRQNIQDCGGQTGDNGRYRFSVSIDGGATWNIGGGNYVPPAFNGCYGIGTVNPTYQRPSRYPNVALFSRGNSSNVDSLGLVYCGPVLLPGGSGWDGSVAGTVLDIADSTGTINVSQEAYVYQNANHYFNYSLVSQVDSRTGAINFWYGSRSWDGSNVGTTFFVNKGTYNSATKQVDWAVDETINLPYYTGFDGSERAANFVIAFSPDGQHGWIGMVGDLVGGEDTAYSPIFIHSDDYGDTWGAPVEVNINGFPALKDTLILNSPDAVFVDSLGNPVDTTKFGLGKATTGFDCDLEVDADGDPHMLVVVGNATSVTNTAAGYSIFSGLGLYVFDVTKDSFGDWNMLYVSRQTTFRGEFGDAATGGSSSFTSDPYLQVSRSGDGTKIFYSWTDTDTAGVGGTDNNAPNLIGRAYDLSSDKLTDVVNWTDTDLDWATRAILPKTGNVALVSGTIFKVPTVVISLDNADAIQPVSFWYFQDVEYDTDTDFNDDPIFFYNCKENPFANGANITSASCAMNNDGAVALAAGGGIAPYSFVWQTGNAADTTSSLSGLAAGVYTGVVTDAAGCTDTLTAIVNNVGAPTADINVATVMNPSCFGSTDGAATVAATGGTGTLNYSWSTSGETTAAATMLVAGRNTVTITDASGCASFAFVDLTEPPAIVVNTSASDVLCNGDGNGSVQVDLATGGVGGFTFSWDDPMSSTTTAVSNLGGGTYTVTVTDANGCNTTATETVAEPAPLSAMTSIFDPSVCASSFDGTASATASGGTAPFTYTWTRNCPMDTSSAGTGSFIFGLDCGNYSVAIVDDNGCEAVVDSILLGGGCILDNIEDEIAAGINSWDLFPNPTSADVNIEINLNQNDAVRLQIIDLKGRTIAARNFAFGLNIRETISLSDVPAGIYLVQLSTSQGTASRKLVVK